MPALLYLRYDDVSQYSTYFINNHCIGWALVHAVLINKSDIPVSLNSLVLCLGLLGKARKISSLVACAADVASKFRLWFGRDYWDKVHPCKSAHGVSFRDTQKGYLRASTFHPCSVWFRMYASASLVWSLVFSVTRCRVWMGHPYPYCRLKRLCNRATCQPVPGSLATILPVFSC